MYSIKIYIVLCFLPAGVVWIFFTHFKKIKSLAAKILFFPAVVVVASLLAYILVLKVGEESSRYSLDKLSYTAESSALWLAYVSETEGGSGYTLGDFDYSPSGIINKIGPSVWVSLFRPYLWEVKNPVMLLAAVESLALLIFFISIVYRAGLLNFFKRSILNPTIVFCFIFTLTFAFAIGISTYNFGSLMRYKIPFIPFFLIGLFLLQEAKPKKIQVVYE